MELASGMRSWMTWAPADLSLEETARHQYRGGVSPANQILLSGRSDRARTLPHCHRGTPWPEGGCPWLLGPHLTAAEIQVQVTDVTVVCQPLQ